MLGSSSAGAAVGAAGTAGAAGVSGNAMPFTCSACVSPLATPLLMLVFSRGCASVLISVGAGGGGGGASWLYLKWALMFVLSGLPSWSIERLMRCSPSHCSGNSTLENVDQTPMKVFGHCRVTYSLFSPAISAFFRYGATRSFR